MKKYSISLNNNPEVKEVTVIDSARVKIGEKIYEYEYKNITENMMILRINNKNFIVKIDKNLDSEIHNTLFEIDINSESNFVTCKSELDLLVEKFSKSHSEGKIKNDVNSPMPGAIVKINVTEGQIVKKGDVLLVLEAMKMENELKAVNDAKVQKIFVEEKKSVDKGQLLIKLEAISK